MQKTLPYPCVHLVFDPGKTAIFGVMRGAFEYRQEGVGRVLGVRFRAGGFRGVLGGPVASITDRTIPLSSIYELDTKCCGGVSVWRGGSRVRCRG